MVVVVFERVEVAVTVVRWWWRWSRVGVGDAVCCWWPFIVVVVVPVHILV